MQNRYIYFFLIIKNSIFVNKLKIKNYYYDKENF